MSYLHKARNVPYFFLQTCFMHFQKNIKYANILHSSVHYLNAKYNLLKKYFNKHFIITPFIRSVSCKRYSIGRTSRGVVTHVAISGSCSSPFFCPCLASFFAITVYRTNIFQKNDKVFHVIQILKTVFLINAKHIILG